MLLTSWSLGLSLISLLVLIVVLRAAFTGVRVIRFWNPSADTPLQIRLEGEIWLSSTLMEYALFLQVISLFLLVVAADSFAIMLPGAMCATGSFLANNYGMKALYVKLISVFFYSFWIMIHRLDVSSPYYPLVKVKNIYLLFLCPLLLTDIILQSLYLQGLHPDIITSCCGVVFQGVGDVIPGLSSKMASITSVVFFYCGSSVLLILVYLRRTSADLFLMVLSALLFPAGLWLVTNFVSPYVYAMPHHRCPFCLLQGEYYFVGYPIFISLFLASCAGLGIALSGRFKSISDLEDGVCSMRRRLRYVCLFSLLLFTVMTVFYPLRYFILGGE